MPGHTHFQILPTPCTPAVVGELETSTGGFTPAVTQLCNVATLPGIVGASIGMPDLHAGYGFAIGERLRLQYRT